LLINRVLWVILLQIVTVIEGAKLQPQKDLYNFDHLTTRNGLSQNTVISICQDSVGYLWFGTYHGVNRYDGYGFKNYRYDANKTNSISHNAIEDMTVTRDGVVWFATGNGLCSYSHATGSFTRYCSDASDTCLQFDKLRTLFEDKDGILWIGTYGGGLYRFDRKTPKFTRYTATTDTTSISNNIVLAVYQDKKSNLWVGTDSGLNLFSNERFIRITKIPTNLQSLSHNAVTTIFEDSAGDLWFGTWGGGMNRLIGGYNGQPVKFMRFEHYNENLPDNIVMKITEDRLKKIWVATRGGGISIFSKDREILPPIKNNPSDQQSLSNNMVNTLLEDRTGIMWAGSYGGIDKTYKKPFDLYRFIPSDSVSSIFKNIFSLWVDSKIDGDVVWLGTETEGLYRWDRSTDLVIRYYPDCKQRDKLPSGYIPVIYSDRNGRLWVGSGGGLSRLDDKYQKFHTFKAGEPGSLSKNDVYSIYQDRTGLLWVGTFEGGLNCLDLNNKKNLFPSTAVFDTVYKYNKDDTSSISDNTVRSIFEDSKGTLWFGTERGGLNRFDGNKFHRLKNIPNESASLSDNYVRCIVETSDSSIWVGTANGLNIMIWDHDRSVVPKFQRYIDTTSSSSNSIHGILQDGKGKFWLSTNKGIKSFDTRTHEFRNYNPGHGLQGEEFAGNVFASGYAKRMYFGGTYGLNCCDTSTFTIDKSSPPLVITEFRILDSIVTLAGKGDTLTLRPRENVLNFSLSALHFHAPEYNQFSYSLSGTRTSYTRKIGNEKVFQLQNLKGGTYHLCITAVNIDEIEGRKEIVLIKQSDFSDFLKENSPTVLIIIAILFLVIVITIATIIINRRTTSTLKKINIAEQDLTCAILTDEDVIFKTLYYQFGTFFRVPNMYIALRDRDDSSLYYAFVYESGVIYDSDKLSKLHSLTLAPQSESRINKVLSSNKPLLSKKEHPKQNLLTEDGFICKNAIAWLGVPLWDGQETLGIVVLFDTESPIAFNERHAQTALTLAQQTAIILQKASIDKEVDYQIKMLRILSGVGDRLNNMTEEMSVCNAIIEEIREQLRCDHCTFFFPKIGETNETYLFPKYSSNNGILKREILFPINSEDKRGIVGWAFIDGATINCASATKDRRFITTTSLSNRDRSILAVPVISANRPLAVICVDTIPAKFKVSDSLFVEGLAHLTANAIQRFEGFQTLHSIGNQIVDLEKHTDITTLLKSIVEGAIRLTRTTSGVIYLINPDNLSIINGFKSRQFNHPDPRMDNPKGLTRSIIHNRKTIIIPNIKDDSRVNPDLIDQFTSMIGIPLQIDNKVIGVIYLNDVKEHTFIESELSLLGNLAAQATIAINNELILQKQKKDSKIAEKYLFIARMLSHKMDKNIARCLRTCDKLEQNNPTAPDNYYQLMLLRKGYRNIQNLIGALLNSKYDFSKQFKICNVTELLRDIKKAFEADVEDYKKSLWPLPEWNYELIIDTPSELPQIYGERLFLWSAIENILQNKLKSFLESTKLREITISCYEKNNQLIIEISSNGLPIENIDTLQYIKTLFCTGTDLDKIIDIEAPLNGTITDKKSSNLGLGLKIVTWIIKEMHKGSLTLDAEVGERSPKFIISIPTTTNIHRGDENE
jgi:ligand-binding sensor domain-containing protein/GAF domain-containing protein